MITFKEKKVLVTGGTGLVGRELVELLVKEGAKVTSISLDENNFEADWDVNYINADLRDINNCFEAVKGQDYVFHIAGIKGSPVLVKEKPYAFFTNFILMNTNMITAMNASETMEWGLYTSTVGTYGPAEIFEESKLWDQMPSRNDWFAGWSKRMAEVQIDAYEQQTGKRNISIIKPVNIYGKFDNFDLRTSTLIPSLVRKVSEADTQVDVWGTGLSKRDIIHARDVARAAIHMVANKVAQPVNVGNGEAITIRTVVETTIKVSGKQLDIVLDATKPTGDDARVANIDRLKATGFVSTVSLEDGIRETYEWYQQHKDNTGRYDAFNGEDKILKTNK
jgi:GDP-L-fucose synthase